MCERCREVPRLVRHCVFCGLACEVTVIGDGEWVQLPPGWFTMDGGRHPGEATIHVCSEACASAADLSHSLRREFESLLNPRRFWMAVLADGRMSAKFGPDWKDSLGPEDRDMVDDCVDPARQPPEALSDRPPPAGTSVLVFRRDGGRDDDVHFCWDCLTEWFGGHSCRVSGRSLFSISKHGTNGLGPLEELPIEDSPYSWAVASTGTS